MVNCPYCGTSNRKSAAYCNNCGGLLGAAPGAASSAAPNASAQARVTSIPAHATGRLPPSSRLASHYLIQNVIGQGGMAAVYKATDTRNNRAVAIKEMSQDGLTPAEVQESLDAFRFEADTLMRLSHPNLPRVFGRFSEGSRHYLVMEYIDGETLEQRFVAGGSKALPERDVMAWADQICAVLTYLHTQKPPIIFRDLKPGNIMLTKSGQIKLIDFGIARVFTPGRIRDTQALGTPGFAPPEQYGKAQTDARADVYALGCTLYHLLSGYDPATTPFALPPLVTRAPSVSPHIQFAIEKATKLDRDQRYASIEEMRKALLYPAGIYFRSGECARNLPELIALCQKYPQEAADHLYVGRIVGWLHAWGEQKAARAAADAVARYKDHAAGLRVFVDNAQPTKMKGKQQAGRGTATPAPGASQRGASAGPAASSARGTGTAGTAGTTAAASAAAATATSVVVVQPRRADFGTLVAGQRGTVTITISGQSGASVQGKITSFDPWLIPDRTSFSGTSTLLQLTAETSKLPRPGLKQTSLHIRSGNQHVYVPVSVLVTPAKAQTGQPRITKVNPAVRPNGQRATAARSHSWGAGFMTGLVASFIVAAAMLAGVPSLLNLWQPGLMSLWPVAAGVLLVAALATAGSALLGVGGRGWPGRVQMTLGSASAGLLIALASGSIDLFANWPVITDQGLGAWHITHALAIAAVFISIGATLGADTVFGRTLLSIWTFLARRMPVLVVLGGMGLGAWAGVVLTAGIMSGALAPVGFVVGMVLGGILAGWVNRAFRRVRVTRAYP